MNSPFYQEVIQGLSKKQKKIASKFLYDKKGSMLFEKICEQKEYYITRTEKKILQSNGKKINETIKSSLGEKICIIEPGAGTGEKVEYLFKHLKKPISYIPVDISHSTLDLLQKNLSRKHPNIKIHPILGDFNDEKILKQFSLLYSDYNKVFFLPGSTLGNFEIDEALKFLKKISKLIMQKKSGCILLGLDIIKKDISIIERAYNDQKGITAQFNKNILTRTNRELSSNFQLNNFKHLAFFNKVKSRIEMHLKSLKDQMITIDNKKIHFKKNETIHIENSYKYNLEIFSENLEKINLKLAKVWYNKNKLFSFCYIVKKK